MAKHLSPHLLKPVRKYRLLAVRLLRIAPELPVLRPSQPNRAEYVRNWRAQRYIQGLTAHGKRRDVWTYDVTGAALESHSAWLKTPRAKALWREQARKRRFELGDINQ